MWIFDKLFGNDKIVTGGLATLDKVVFTDEERSDAKQEFLKLYVPFKIAQRYLAIIFSVPYVIAFMITFVASFFVDVSVQIDLLKGDIGTIVLAIVGFYFFGGATEGIVNAVNNRKK